MKCRSQSIAESPIDQADDIKRQTCQLMHEDLSDNEIRQYFADRYGDSINFRPPLKPTTWFLWGGPILLLGVGGFAFVRVVRARMSQPLDEDLE
jgi:cytochrome c-type biogenesis protein CcmH